MKLVRLNESARREPSNTYGEFGDIHEYRPRVGGFPGSCLKFVVEDPRGGSALIDATFTVNYDTRIGIAILHVKGMGTYYSNESRSVDFLNYLERLESSKGKPFGGFALKQAMNKVVKSDRFYSERELSDIAGGSGIPMDRFLDGTTRIRDASTPRYGRRR